MMSFKHNGGSRLENGSNMVFKWPCKRPQHSNVALRTSLSTKPNVTMLGLASLGSKGVDPNVSFLDNVTR